jgi:electron transport complex protein RnfB
MKTRLNDIERPSTETGNTESRLAFGPLMTADLVDQIDALLPQTQCTKCGYQGCRPYADAIVSGEADINQCPPGGAAGISKLATLLGRKEKPLNPVNGTEQVPATALIDERWCIGCTLCIQACPVDAIVGGPKLMHTVLLEHCTGCELCIPPCPVDCIEMVDLTQLGRRGAIIADPGGEAPAALARARYAFHQQRIVRERKVWETRQAAKEVEKPTSLAQVSASPDAEPKRAAIQRALDRARAKRKHDPRPVNGPTRPASTPNR